MTADLPESDGRSSANHVLGVALQMAGDLEGARDVMAERLERGRLAGNDFVVAVESANLSMVERKLGNLDGAEALSLEALRTVSRQGDEMAIPWVINGLSAVTAAQGRLQRAATLIGIAESLLAQAGGEWPADEREQYEGALAIVTAGLAPAELATARASGAAKSLDDAVAYALATDGGRDRMSEPGWKAFLAADDLEDWAVLHGGATAAYRVGSMADAARLAEAIAAVPGLEAAGAVLTISGARLTVRLTRDMWQLETDHIQLARAVSAVARSNGARSERASIQEVQLAIAAKPDDIDKPFWAAILGYTPLADDNIVDPLGHGSTVWMQELDAAKSLKHAMHVDVSVAREQARARLDAALAAGGRIVTESNEHWTLSDRAGNRVCIAVWPDGGTTADPAA